MEPLIFLIILTLLVSGLYLDSKNDDDNDLEENDNSLLQNHIDNLKEGINEIEKPKTTCKGREYIKPEIKKKLSLVKLKDPYPKEEKYCEKEKLKLALVLDRGYRKAMILFPDGYKTGKSVKKLELEENLSKRADQDYIDNFLL